MNRLSLLARNIRYFRGVNIAVVLGMAVATAVLSGALMVGDSVRGSLADLTRRRLGPVDAALISTRFFNAALAGKLGSASIVPAVVIRGGAVNDSSTQDPKPRTADVQIAALGAPSSAASAFDSLQLNLQRGQCVVNAELSAGLGAATGTSLLLSAPKQSDAPRDAALSRVSRNDVLNDIRADVARVDSNQDFAALFSPNPSQRVPRNAWANLKDVQEAIEQDDRVNVLLAHAADASTPSDDLASSLNQTLLNVLQTDPQALDFYGLTLIPVGDGEASLFARETYIAPPAVDAAHRAADALHVRLREVAVNLVNAVTDVSSGAKPVHYAVAAGISSLDEGALGPADIAINQWTADQLHAKVGDKIAIDFYLRQAGGNLSDASKALPADKLTFTVKYILPMSGLGADAKLPPNYKGLTDASSVADWDPPEGLVIDKKLVTPEDEQYWKTWRAAPKLFVSIDTARQLWGGVYGDVTGLRVPAADAPRFQAEFLKQLKPESMGLVFRPIKSQQLAASQGGTDFSMFFVMFSFFLIIAAGLLVAMLFRLNVEQRARQLGLMAAVGFAPKTLRRLALSEGLILAAIGGLIGLGGAIGYTDLIMYGLRTWWIGAVGTTAMTLHVVPLTLIYGFVGSLFVALLAILWAVWRVGKVEPARLLAGGWGSEFSRRGAARWLRWAALAGIIIGLGIVAVGLTGKISAEEGFGGGALLLCGLLAWLGASLRPRRHPGAAFVGSLTRLGIRNASRHTSRGVLSVGLVAFAVFTLITVAAMKQNGVKNPDDPNSETGGYRLILSSGIPLNADLNTVAGRKLLGIEPPNDSLFDNVHFTPLRQWAGQDVSCLNLTRPNSPTILGLPPEMISRGGFVTGDSIEKGKCWTLLNSDQADAIPVIADSDTVEYVLQISLGDTIPFVDQLGRPRKLKLVATIKHSIFQGQLLMSDENFRKLFPAQSGFGVVLVQAAVQAPLIRRLGADLGDYSVSVDTSVQRLQTYQNVQNTYLETFQTLGALGLMLGTLGLAVVLVRTVIERRSELALLASIGFSAARRVELVLSENTLLLFLGLILGSVSAIVGILPAIWRESRPINLGSLSLTIAIVAVVGIVSSVAAVALSGVRVRPADLRRE